MSLALSLRARRFLVAAAAGLLALPTTVVLQAAPAARAATPCPIPGGFEIDGDMTQSTCSPAGDDWNTPKIGVQSTSQGGTYSSSSKDDSNTSGWSSSGHTPNKTDFSTAYTTARIVNGDYYVYVGWERTSTTGSQGYAIEIDNAATNVAADGTPQPDRTNGGFVFYINTNGSSAPTFGGDCTFTSQSDYGSTCSNSQAGFAGAVNTGDFTDPLSGASITAGQFYEVSLDVTSLTGIAPACPAQSSVASLYLRSITGNVANSSDPLKGYLQPFTITPDSTCVAPDISTTATPGNGSIDGLSVVAPGTAQHDEVTVGTAQAPGVGSVKFYLCQPADVTVNVGCKSGGDLVSTKTLDAAGKASSSAVDGKTTPNDTAPGTYCWRAEFTPSADDHNYLAGTHTNYDSECFTVAHASPSIATQITVTTQQGAAPGSLGLTTVSDTATLSGVVPDADLSGQTVTFSLYGPFGSAPSADSCGGTPVATRTGTLTKVDATTWQATTTLPSSTVSPTAAGYYTWVASYAGDAIDDAAADGCGQANETAHILGASVSVEKDTSTPTINAGDTASFDIKVQNLGGGTATGVVVTDPLPVLASGHTWTLTTPGGNPFDCSLGADPGRAGAQLVTCTIGTLNPTGWVTVATVSTATGPADCGTISNTASLTATNGGGSGSSTSTVTVNCADLSITKTPDKREVNATDSIGFTVTVTNSGKGDAYGVTVTDTLPGNGGLNWSVDSTSAGTTCDPISGDTLTCHVGTLLHGTSATVHVTSPTTPATCGTVANTASVTAANTSGGSAEASVLVDCPDVSISKTADAAAVNAGTQIGFVITVTNNGTGTAYGVDLADTMPSGTGISWSIDTASGPLSCSPSSAITTLSCTGDLPADGVETVHVVSDTSYASCATYDNTASVTVRNESEAIDPASASTTVDCAAVVIDKTADHADPVDVGSNIGFTITVTNNGNGDALGVTVTDALPSGPGIWWIVDAQTGPLECAPTTGVTTLTCSGDLAAGASETVHVYSATMWKVVEDRTVNSCDNGNDGQYDNTAQVTWSNGPELPISSPTAVETVICPDVTFTKIADSADPVAVGDPIGFRLHVSNAGPGTAAGVVVDDPLPMGPGIDWRLDPANTPAGCAVTADPQSGAQTLHCTLGDLAADTDVTVHVVSDTSWTGSGGSSCDNGNGGVYANDATLTMSNAPGSGASASTTVECPDVQVTKVADAQQVNVSSPIGFTITVTNPDEGNTGRAKDVAVSDPLPTGPADSGVLWTVDSVVGAPASSCHITVSDTAQQLDCTFAQLDPNQVVTVHVSSPTTWTVGSDGTTLNSCGTYDNTVTVTAGNEPGEQTASDSTTVVCPALDTNLVKADDPSVSAGQDIGFTLSGHNQASQLIDAVRARALSAGGFAAANAPLAVLPGTVLDAVLVSKLPAGNDVLWHIDPAYSGSGTCAIAGGAGAQVLTCLLGDLAPDAGFSVHIRSTTTQASCGSYLDKGDLSSGNVPTVTSQDTTEVLCPVLALTKVGDAPAANGLGQPGQNVGYTLTATNTGEGTALNAVLTDPLPGTPLQGAAVPDHLNWSIDSSSAGSNCAITGDVGSQTLTCAPGDLGPGASITVHITSPTDDATCGTIDNTGTFIADNADGVTASAELGVICAAIITPTPTPPSHTPQGTTVPPLSNTGAGPLGDEIGWALGLLGLGLLLVLGGGRRRRYRRAH